MGESSGGALSHNSSLDLTDNNTVTQGIGSGQIPFARQFTRASSEYLTRADEALISIGSVEDSFTWAVWCNLDDVASDGYIIGKWNGTLFEYGCRYEAGAGNAFQFLFSQSADSVLKSVSCTNFGAATVGAWNFLQFWYDAPTDVMGIRVDRCAPNYTTGVSGPPDTAATMVVGSLNGSIDNFNGRMAGLAFWKRRLTLAELDIAYNNGVARHII